MPPYSALPSLPVSLIRQHVFCPRIPFYNEVLSINPGDRPWQSQGVSYHKRQEMLMRRRRLERFGLSEATLKINISLYSEKKSLHGICDALLIDEEQIVPLEFKLSSSFQPRRGHILQLAAYGVLAEEQFGKPCEQMFILYGDKGKMHRVKLDEALRSSLMRTVDTMRENLRKPLLPASSATNAQCGQCEYLNFCADRE